MLSCAPFVVQIRLRAARCLSESVGAGVWHGMVEVCEGAPVAVSGWVLTDRHDVRPCAASSLLRVTMSVSNVIGGHGNTRHGVGTKLFGLGPTSSAGQHILRTEGTLPQCVVIKEDVIVITGRVW